MTWIPSSRQRSRSRVASTSSNQPTLRWVAPHTLVLMIGPLPSLTLRPRTGMRALVSKASCAPQSTNLNVSPTFCDVSVRVSGRQVLHGGELVAVVLGGAGAEREVGDGRADLPQGFDGAAGAVGVAERIHSSVGRQDDLDVGVPGGPRLGLLGLPQHARD